LGTHPGDPQTPKTQTKGGGTEQNSRAMGYKYPAAEEVAPPKRSCSLRPTGKRGLRGRKKKSAMVLGTSVAGGG